MSQFNYMLDYVMERQNLVLGLVSNLTKKQVLYFTQNYCAEMSGTQLFNTPVLSYPDKLDS